MVDLEEKKDEQGGEKKMGKRGGKEFCASHIFPLSFEEHTKAFKPVTQLSTGQAKSFWLATEKDIFLALTTLRKQMDNLILVANDIG